MAIEQKFLKCLYKQGRFGGFVFSFHFLGNTSSSGPQQFHKDKLSTGGNCCLLRGEALTLEVFKLRLLKKSEKQKLTNS